MVPDDNQFSQPAQQLPRTVLHPGATLITEELIHVPTALQIQANQTNAQHSTGPKTESGKAVSAKNALRHGLASGLLITFWESKEDYDALLADLIEEHQPATTTETLVIHQMAQHHWLAQRAIFLQQRVIREAEEPTDPGKNFEVFVRYQTTNERAFHKALSVLTKLKSERKKQEIGFVPQKAAAASASSPLTERNRGREEAFVPGPPVNAEERSRLP